MMPDRETIIAAMKWCRENTCNGCPCEQNQDEEGQCNIDADIIALLKEQPEIIYCKDCKYLKWTDADDEVCFCRLQNMGHHWDFFCADGERKEADDS